MVDWYVISEQYHEKKGTYIYVLKIIKKIDKDEFFNLREYAKDYDGYYSSYRGVNGFVFQTEEDAESFGAILDSYFGSKNIDNDIVEVEIVEKKVLPRKTKRQRIKTVADGAELEQEIVQMSSGMPLHIALKNVIQTHGEDIIKDVKLVNILDDFHAYDEFPVARYILRSIIADGYSSKLYSIGQWNSKALQLESKFVSTTGFIPNHVNRIFKSFAFGFGWINELEIEVEELLESENPSTPQYEQKKSKKRTKGLHLKFKGVEICGDPNLFANKLESVGFEQGVWCDNFFTMKGNFVGVSNCEIRVYFDSCENTVYRVYAQFPWYQNRERLANDYKKLKKSLQDLYGKPKCEYENLSQDWTSTYNTPLGVIKLECFPGNCPQVCIDYYDGYYDNHHGEIIDDVAKLDL